MPGLVGTDLPATARRELWEELGVRDGLWEMGCLPDGVAKARTRFTPVVLRWEDPQRRIEVGPEIARPVWVGLPWLVKAGSARRKAYTDTFLDAARATAALAPLGLVGSDADLLVKAQGNHAEILAFLKSVNAKDLPMALALLRAVSDKDLRDTPASVLLHHLQGAQEAAPDLATHDPAAFQAWVLNPRVDVEFLTTWRQAGGAGLSFPVIATIHGETLHNHFHGHTLKSGDVFLLDCGAEGALHYAGDLSSTFPVDRTFTARQRDIYQVALDAHLAAVAKAGARRVAGLEDLLQSLEDLHVIPGAGQRRGWRSLDIVATRG